MEKNKKQLIETLSRGMDSAKKLQNLLHHKSPNIINDDGLLVSVDDLANEISQSFYRSLLVLNSCNSGRLPVTAAGHLNSGDQPAVKRRRGSYKRRKTMDSRMEVSDTIEDGYAWRKYGQKEILNYDFPRCYYRCTHKQVHGCKALKQVQKLEDGSNMFQILYFDHHTCPPPNTYSHPLDLDSKNSPYSPSTITNKHIDPSQSCNKVSSVSGAQSPPALAWKEILLNEFECFKKDGSLSDMSLDDITFS
ncbi:hypothetical protein SSX86_018187 [Deinandra increscens subsp. villosa]|uniref:WRKY domain-containing protein n=1 Tax=Deinandra increscens subsp. villosa TaxID=3103831 RepID=A0AAP0CVK5_9ASTR